MEWISSKDRMPDIDYVPILVFIENQIYLGMIFSSSSSTYDTNNKLIAHEKTSTFYVDLPYEKSECDECPGDIMKGCCGQCTDCCEYDHEVDNKQLAFNLEKIDYWMLIKKPM